MVYTEVLNATQQGCTRLQLTRMQHFSKGIVSNFNKCRLSWNIYLMKLSPQSTTRLCFILLWVNGSHYVNHTVYQFQLVGFTSRVLLDDGYDLNIRRIPTNLVSVFAHGYNHYSNKYWTIAPLFLFKLTRPTTVYTQFMVPCIFGWTIHRLVNCLYWEEPISKIFIYLLFDHFLVYCFCPYTTKLTLSYLVHYTNRPTSQTSYMFIFEYIYIRSFIILRDPLPPLALHENHRKLHLPLWEIDINSLALSHS